MPGPKPGHKGGPAGPPTPAPTGRKPKPRPGPPGVSIDLPWDGNTIVDGIEGFVNDPIGSIAGVFRDEPIRVGPGYVPGSRAASQKRAADFAAWVNAANGPAGDDNGSGAGGGDGGFGAWLAGQTASTNQMYDQMLGVLGKQVGGGQLAINAAHRDLTNELSGLGRESKRAHRGVSRQIARRGRQGLGDLSRALGDQKADLGRSGADLKALLAEGQNAKTALVGARDRRSTVSDRLAQLLGDDLGNYQRLGETNQAGYRDALSSAEALQRAQIEMQRIQALQSLAAAGGGGGGGGGGGSSSSGRPIDMLAEQDKVGNRTKSILQDQYALGQPGPQIDWAAHFNPFINDLSVEGGNYNPTLAQNFSQRYLPGLYNGTLNPNDLIGDQDFMEEFDQYPTFNGLMQQAVSSWNEQDFYNQGAQNIAQNGYLARGGGNAGGGADAQRRLAQAIISGR